MSSPVTIARGLRVLDTPPSGGKLFHQKVLDETISTTNCGGRLLNGSMLKMHRVAAFFDCSDVSLNLRNMFVIGRHIEVDPHFGEVAP